MSALRPQSKPNSKPSRRDMFFSMVGRSSGVPAGHHAYPAGNHQFRDSVRSLDEIKKSAPKPQPRRRDMFFTLVALSSGVPARRPTQDTPFVVEEAPRASSPNSNVRRRDVFSTMVARSSGVAPRVRKRAASTLENIESPDSAMTSPSVELHEIIMSVMPSHIIDDDEFEEIETPMSDDSRSSISSSELPTPALEPCQHGQVIYPVRLDTKAEPMIRVVALDEILQPFMQVA